MEDDAYLQSQLIGCVDSTENSKLFLELLGCLPGVPYLKLPMYLFVRVVEMGALFPVLGFHIVPTGVVFDERWFHKCTDNLQGGPKMKARGMRRSLTFTGVGCR